MGVLPNIIHGGWPFHGDKVDFVHNVHGVECHGKSCPAYELGGVVVSLKVMQERLING